MAKTTTPEAARQVIDTAALVAGSFIDAYPEEAARALEDLDVGEVRELLESQGPARAAALLERLPEQHAVESLVALRPESLQGTLARLDPARAASLLGRLDEEARERLLGHLDAGLVRELRELMSYPDDTAGSLMDTRVLTFRPRTTVEETLERLRARGRRDVRHVVVVEGTGHLVALLSLTDVAVAPPRQRLARLVSGPAPRVHALAPTEEVAEAFSAYRVSTLPVVDGAGRLLGVIRQDALIHAVKEEATADLATLVGASREELALSPALFAVRKRLPWLNINLLTAFLAAAVVGLFESTIAQFTALAVLLPVVAGQSGNTGAQALAVVIRGLALREIRARHWLPVLAKEALVGAVNGVAVALVTMAGVFVWSGSWGLCLVIGLAMVISMAIASVSGAAIPLVLAALRQDPAQSGSIILTTVTDVMGFFSFLGLATAFSAML